MTNGSSLFPIQDALYFKNYIFSNILISQLLSRSHSINIMNNCKINNFFQLA